MKAFASALEAHPGFLKAYLGTTTIERINETWEANNVFFHDDNPWENYVRINCK